MRRRWFALAWFGVLGFACRGQSSIDGDGDGVGESGIGGPTGGSAAAADTGGDTGPQTSGMSGQVDGSGSNSQGNGASDSANSGPRFDVGADSSDDTGGDCPTGPGSPGNYDFSIIWVSNTTQGTVSKIDTASAVELARYFTGADAPDPSRTSVNLAGDVAVGNRSGSVTKIAARVEDCIDHNGNGTIETSQAWDDVLPWGDDECVLWHHDIPFDNGGSNTGGPRAIAWDADPTATDCDAHPNLWVGWRNQPNEEVMVRKIDGDNGTMIDEVLVPNWEGNWGHGTYGGAADADGAFWGLGTLGTLITIDPDLTGVTTHVNPVSHVMYGIALDANGDPWLAGYGGKIWWFDRLTETFNDMGDSNDGPSRFRGLAIDSDGHAWLAGNDPCGLTRYDTINRVLVDSDVGLSDCEEPVGVSIDVDGKVWVVDRDAEVAYRVDPDDYSATITVGNLVNPYTYSDMTGAGLNLVINPPG